MTDHLLSFAVAAMQVRWPLAALAGLSAVGIALDRAMGGRR